MQLDEPALQRAFHKLTPDEIYLRFFAPLKALSHAMATRFTQIDYDRQMVLILTDHGAPVSIAMTRRMLWAGLAMPHPMEAHRMDSRAVWVRGRSGAAFEGVTSFLEKRDAVFPDNVSEKWDEFAAFFDDPDYC